MDYINNTNKKRKKAKKNVYLPNYNSILSKLNTILKPKQIDKLDKINEIIKLKMSEELYRHSIGTLSFLLDLLKRHYPDFFSVDNKNSSDKKLDFYFRIDSGRNFLYKACLAAVLHDYGKIFKDSELLDIAIKNNIRLNDFEQKCYPLIHSFAGPFIIKKEIGITFKEVMRAVKSHTIGSLKMNLMDKLVYISDKLEITRDFDGVDYLRKLSIKDLDLCLLEVYKSNIIYVISKNSLLHPDTSKIWNFICGGYKNVT